MSEEPAETRRDRGRPVSVDEIATSALAMIDEVGLEGLTMRALADSIGVKPMTIYRYLANKEAILAVVADRLWQQLPEPDPSIQGWQNQLRAMWGLLFELMLDHPQAIPLIARGAAYSNTAASSTAGMVAVLKRAGFSPQHASEFVHAAGSLVVGFAFGHLWQAQAGRGEGPSEPAGTLGSIEPELLGYLAQLGPFVPAEFAATLDVLIAAFEAKLEAG